MAIGSSNMTTYKASQVIGNNSAQNLTGALLQSGASAERDTWIFANTYSGIDGIKHVYNANTNKFKVINNSTDQFWVDVDNGDVYVAGKLGIGYDPNTSGNTYKLYVNGLSYFNNSAYFYDKIGIGYDPETQGNTYKLYVNGSAYFNIGTSDNTSDLKFVINGNSRYLALGGGGIQARTSADAVTTLYLNFNGGQTYVGGSGYLVGNVGIGYDPDTNGNTYKLYVNGTSYFNGNMTSIGDIYIKKSSSHLYLVNTQWTKGTTPSTQTWSAVEFLSNDASNSRIALLETTLDTSGNSQFNIYLVPNVANSTSWSGIVLKKTSAGVLTVSIAGDTTASGNITANGGYLKATANSNTVTIGSQNTGWCHIQNSANIPFYFNKTIGLSGDIGTTDYPANNVYIGKSNGAGIYYQGTKACFRMIRFVDNTSDANGNGISIGGGGLTVLGSGESADTILSNLSLTASGGSETTYIASDNSILFYPGQQSYDAAAKIEMSAGRIWAGVNGNTTRENQVGVQSGAGQLYLWSAAATSGDRGLYLPAHGSGGSFAIIRSNTNNFVTILGDDVWGASVRINSNWIGFYNARQGGTRYGYIQCNNNRMYFRKENGVSTYHFDMDGGYLITSRCYNAVWNDFAECREVETEDPGYCVTEITGGKMIKTTKRLQAGCKITSDTYGTCIGQTDIAKTPIAVSGRVLVYPYKNKNKYTLGAAVCSAPGGTVDLMTRDEIMMYPERIVGTVSEIPEYEIWHCGSKELPEEIKVNGRIWVYVK